LDGFEKAILEHKAGFHIWIDREKVASADELDRITGSKAIRIVPMVAGAKSGGASVLLGAALIFAAPYLVALMPGAVTYGAMAGTAITGIGTSMILGGISQMLFSPPTPAAQAARSSNLLFSGAVNTSAQGNPIPLCYGRMLVGSQVIAAGIESVQIPANPSTAYQWPVLS
jgi:predicted phage tail protein